MRKAGIAGISRLQQSKQEFQKQSLLIASDQFEKYNTYLKKFQENLKEFARKYSKEIKSEKEFRAQFLEMCVKIGVDPLASAKGFWGELLGIGDFYYELGIQILEVTLATSHRNGGIISTSRIKELIQRDVSEEDILKSLNNIQVLGNGLEIIKLNSEIFLSCIPRELDKDLLQVLEFVKTRKCVTTQEIMGQFTWEVQRVSRAIENMVKEGIFWVDEQVEPKEYYVCF